MANPTNVNVPPPLAADPTNINIPVHGTKYPSAVVGSDFVFELSQKSDLGDAVTAVLADTWTAPFRLYLRSGRQFNYAIAATQSYSLTNDTQSIDIVASNSPTSNTASAITFASAAARIVEAGDVLKLLVTTSGGSGASKGLSVKFHATQLEGSATNPV